MSFYRIYHAEEQEIESLLLEIPLLRQAEGERRQRIADALLTSLKNSKFTALGDAPFSRHCTHYRLLDHINEVAELGMLLADRAEIWWREDPFTAQMDRQLLLQALILHDVDKYMLLSDEQLEKRISHGTLGAMLLHDLGFPDRIVELVACHSPSASLHIPDPIAMILHYSDLYSCDHIYMLIDRPPLFCGK